MNDTVPRHCNVLWLDTASPISESELSQINLAGVTLLTIQNLADLKREFDNVDAVVIRLTHDIALMEQVLGLLRGLKRRLPVICRVAPHRLDLGVRAMQGGAAHVLACDDWSVEGWRSVLLHLSNLRDLNSLRVAENAPQQTFVFADPLSLTLLELARRVAAAGVTTLLTGPTGAGKEVLARVLHEASPRHNGPFVALNCAAIPESMIEDLLFGHEKGAFTGATRDHRGVFEQAEGGSLFLDEVAELPYALQAKLLRVLQERQVTRLGAQVSLPVDVRLITATNKDLRAAMQAREFREDLYYRISTFRLRIPALAERAQDILPLARHMLENHAEDGQSRTLTNDAKSRLLSYGWPGNVRELSNVMQRALVLSSGPVIDVEHLLFDEPEHGLSLAAGMTLESAGMGPVPAGIGPGSNDPIRCEEKDEEEATASFETLADRRLGVAIRSSEHRLISAALHAAPNRVEAARALGISPRTLRYKLAQLRDHGLSVASAK